MPEGSSCKKKDGVVVTSKCGSKIAGETSRLLSSIISVKLNELLDRKNAANLFADFIASNDEMSNSLIYIIIVILKLVWRKL